MSVLVTPETPRAVRVGARVNVLLLVESGAMLRGMKEVLQAMPQAALVRGCTSADELLDALMWEPVDWHLAFVDFALRRGRRLPRPGPLGPGCLPALPAGVAVAPAQGGSVFRCHSCIRSRHCRVRARAAVCRSKATRSSSRGARCSSSAR